MIVFKNVRWKNLLSTGNSFIEVQLNKSSNTLIIGDNGAGKSTILDALCFGLFNKPFRSIKKDQLINSVNQGGTLVEIEFIIGNREYLVRRGIKKNLFEIYRCSVCFKFYFRKSWYIFCVKNIKRDKWLD